MLEAKVPSDMDKYIVNQNYLRKENHMLGMSTNRGPEGRGRNGKKHGRRHGDGHHRERERRHKQGCDHGDATGHRNNMMMAHRSIDAGKNNGAEHFSTNGAVCPLCEKHCPANDAGCRKGTDILIR